MKMIYVTVTFVMFLLHSSSVSTLALGTPYLCHNGASKNSLGAECTIMPKTKISTYVKISIITTVKIIVKNKEHFETYFHVYFDAYFGEYFDTCFNTLILAHILTKSR